VSDELPELEASLDEADENNQNIMKKKKTRVDHMVHVNTYVTAVMLHQDVPGADKKLA
jgi:hypothetical protein